MAVTDFLFSKTFTFSALAAGAAYVIYFDYRRRTDPAFRKYLKQQNRAAKELYQRAQANSASAGAAFGAPSVAMDWDDDYVPSTPADKEAYFMKQLTLGENFLQGGPAYYEVAAMAFYRAIKMFPEPAHLLELISQKAPAKVTQLIVERMKKDVQSQTARIVEEVDTVE